MEAKIKLSQRKKARIEIIPLIDVIFFLLATFVLFTLSLNRIQSLPVDLPQAAAAAPSSEKPELVTLQVSDLGNIYWNRELIQIEELESRLITYHSQHAMDAKILVTSDNRARFGTAVAVLDLIRKIGIQKISVETRIRATGK